MQPRLKMSLPFSKTTGLGGDGHVVEAWLGDGQQNEYSRQLVKICVMFSRFWSSTVHQPGRVSRNGARGRAGERMGAGVAVQHAGRRGASVLVQSQVVLPFP